MTESLQPEILLDNMINVLFKGLAEHEIPRHILNARKGLEVVGNTGWAREERDFPNIFEYLGWCT